MRNFLTFIIATAATLLLWLIWQLIQAKRFTRFKQRLEQEVKPKVMAAITQELEDTRSELYPNGDEHLEATLFFWGQYKVRILQAALQREIIDEKWLKDTGNWRNSQHLFFIEQDKLNKTQPQTSDKN